MFENIFTNPSAEEKANKAFAELARRIDALDKRISQLSAVYYELQAKIAKQADYDGTTFQRILLKVIDHVENRLKQLEANTTKENKGLFTDVHNRLVKLEADHNNKPNSPAQSIGPGRPDITNSAKYMINSIDAASVAGTTTSRLYYLAIRGRLGYTQKGRNHHMFYRIEDLVKLREDDLAKSRARTVPREQSEIPITNTEAT